MRKTDADGKPQKLAKRDDKTDIALNEQCIWEGIGIIQFPMDPRITVRLKMDSSMARAA